jgi:Na+/phosphate symporter
VIDRRLALLIVSALVLSVGHHLDHVIRGNHVGWPVTSQLNAFSASLIIYPLILGGLALTFAGRMGPRGWAFLSGGGAIFLAVIHFGPWAVEPPEDIISMYDSPLLGWLAFGWLLALVATLVVATLYEIRLWRRGPEALSD